MKVFFKHYYLLNNQIWMNKIWSVLSILFLIEIQSIEATDTIKPPFIKSTTGVCQLMVQAKPWVMLAGELHNSSSSDLAYMETIWNKLNELYLNTVIASVSWELFEPEEGKFDFSLVDGIIKGAREHDLKLVLIWFGTWKNGWSTYVPEWVKTELKRFPRMQAKPGENSGALSAFSENTLQADAKAFAALMKHIREVDAAEQTVIMLQVENETGVLHTSRDKSPLAEAMFQQPIPAQLSTYLQKQRGNLRPEMKALLSATGRTTGSWSDVFGFSADEAFQAWYVASFVGKVVEKGKKEYNIPMYVNAWLDPNFAESIKTEYPSGGPVSKVIDIWKAAAPSIDLYAPDIYLEDFKRVCNQYAQQGNPLFIPEAHRDARAAANVYYALGEHNAIGFSPFGIDALNADHPLSSVYKSLTGFLPFWAKNQGILKSRGFIYTNSSEEKIELGDFVFTIHYTQKRDLSSDIPEAAGLILQLNPNEFIFTGFGYHVRMAPSSGKGWVEIIKNDEGEFVNGIWKSGRRMNGDEMEISFSSKPEFRWIKIQTIK